MTQRKLKAQSLVEVLVVLAIVASSMVYIAAANVRSLISIKDDELADTANGIMYQGMELALAPTVVSLVDTNGQPVTSFGGNYKFQFNSTGATLVKQQDIDPVISTCSPSSKYQVTLANSNQIICSQVIITAQSRPLTGDVYYQIQSNVVYQTSNAQPFNSLTSYRRGSFQ